MLERVSQVREMLNSSCHPFQTNLWAVPKKEWGQTLLVQSDVRTAGFRIIQISVIQHGRLPGKDAKTWDTSVINFYMEHQVQGVYSVFVHFSKPGHCPPLPVLPVLKFSFTKIPPYKFSTHSKIKYHVLTIHCLALTLNELSILSCMHDIYERTWSEGIRFLHCLSHEFVCICQVQCCNTCMVSYSQEEQYVHHKAEIGHRLLPMPFPASGIDFHEL